MKNLCILGSTGSIGRNVLRVVEAHGDILRPLVLSARKNLDLLLEQARKFRPKTCVIADTEVPISIARELSELGVEVVLGEDALPEVATLPEVDLLVCATEGMSGFIPMVRALKAGKSVLFANKEAFVSGSEVIMPLARENPGKLIPLDSEHSAIFQCLRAGKMEEVEKIILTASGGPFWRKTLDELKNASLEDVLAHPTWKMGKKVTVNSATLFNKGLEVLEAMSLFEIPLSKIEVLLHPQSIVHGIVAFRDGSMLAQMSETDMAVPIQYALTYPERISGVVRQVALEQIGRLEFCKVDPERFPAVFLCYEAGEKPWWVRCALCAINEALVDKFLAGKISFYELSTKLAPLFSQREKVIFENFGAHTPTATVDNVLKVFNLFYEFGRNAT